MPFVLLVPPRFKELLPLVQKPVVTDVHKVSSSLHSDTQNTRANVSCVVIQNHRNITLFELGRTFEGHPVPPSCNEQLQPEQAAQSLIQLEPECSQAWRFHHPDHKDVFPYIQPGIYICVYWISQLVKIDLYFFLM